MISVSRFGRLTELDGLRGIAALWVVIFHFSFGTSGFWGEATLEHDRQIAPFTINLEGLLAVDLFFMISGFVIVMTLDRCNSIVDFAISRFSRLFPAYWACLALTTATIVLLPVSTQTVTAAQVIAGTTMLHTFIGFSSVESVYWSLSFELAFYALMACIWATGRLSQIELLGAGWLVLSAVSFSIFPDLGRLIPFRLQVATILPYAPLFLAGILLFRARTLGWTWLRAALLIGCLIARVASFQKPVLIIGTILIFVLFTAASIGWAAFLRWKPIVFLGSISYPLYLVHLSIGYRFQRVIVLDWGLSQAVGFAITTIGACVLAWAISVAIEQPIQNKIRTAYRTFVGNRRAAPNTR